jgi:endonuclease YncB( thermonuclease family)
MSLRPLIHSFLRALLAGMGMSGIMVAQESPPIGTARADFLKLVLSDSQILSDQYERALAKLESELAAGADYEEAQLVQQRREELKAIYGAASASPAAGITLLPSRARLSGSAEARGEMLTGWRGSSSMAEWGAVRLSPGVYFLELEANITGLPTSAGGVLPERSMPQDTASFVFYEVSLLPGAQENRRSFEIVRGPSDAAFTPLRIGPLNFTRNSVTLRIAPTMSYPGNVISIRNIRLVPDSGEGLLTAAPLPEGDQLAAAREQLHRELALVQKPVINAHSDALATLAENPALHDAALAETQRLNVLQRNVTNKPTDVLPRMLRQLGGVAGFIDLEGAKLVTTDSTSSGDHFIIEHEGTQIPVRLLWVRCAALDSGSEENRNFAKHFRIEQADIGQLSRTAREFTLGYLAGKPLRLLLRPNKDKDGHQPALVFLPEIGLYQNVLVDQGLAAVDPPRKTLSVGMMERGLIESLQQREEVARRQKNGAWALSGDTKP